MNLFGLNSSFTLKKNLPELLFTALVKYRYLKSTEDNKTPIFFSILTGLHYYKTIKLTMARGRNSLNLQLLV